MKRLVAAPRRCRLITAAVFGALTLSCGATSNASDDVRVYRRVVKFGDLNLSNSRDAARLYNRILVAARDVCSWSPYEVFLEAKARAQRCVDKAVVDAVTRVDHPQLIAAYNANKRQPLPIIIAKAPPR